MRPALISAAVTLVATAGAGGAAGAVVPGLLGGVAAALVAGALVHVLGERAPVATATATATTTATDTKLTDAIAANSQLRHDLRGALSPALLVSDRLTGHADPAVAKAGNIVVRAVERATALLETNKHDDAGRLAPAGVLGGIVPGGIVPGRIVPGRIVPGAVSPPVR